MSQTANECVSFLAAFLRTFSKLYSCKGTKGCGVEPDSNILGEGLLESGWKTELQNFVKVIVFVLGTSSIYTL